MTEDHLVLEQLRKIWAELDVARERDHGAFEQYRGRTEAHRQE